MLNPRVKTWRIFVLFALPTAALLAMAARAICLQSLRGEELARTAQRQQRRLIVLPGRPGNILARTRGGHVIVAGSRQAPSCFADPRLLGAGGFAEAATQVATVIGCRSSELEQTLRERQDRRFAYLARDLTDLEAQAILDMDLPAVSITHEWRRHYPMGQLASHVLGFRRIDGLAGVGAELGADRWLAPKDGYKVVRMDASGRGRYAEVDEYQPPADGSHVLLTIDVMIQGFLEKALAATVAEFGAEAAMGTIMDPNTGEVLAMESFPTYDPNAYSKAAPGQRRNRAITDPVEPGSVFKPLVASGALQLGAATMQTEFFCHNGHFNAPRGGHIGEYSKGFGTINMSQALIQSSNIYMAQLGLMLGKESLHRIGEAYGLGMRTGIDLPGESPGRLVPTKKWTTYATPRMPFGQGPVMVTNLQLACAFSAIANGGELLRPWVIDRVVDADGGVIHRGRRQVVRRVLSREVARQLIDEALAHVVQEGTGRAARLDEWQLFGKTGTAQIGGPGGYEEGAYVASFVAGAPADRPVLVCVVSIHRPDRSKGYAGGKVAAPCVRDVLRQSLAYMDVPRGRPAVLVHAGR